MNQKSSQRTHKLWKRLAEKPSTQYKNLTSPLDVPKFTSAVPITDKTAIKICDGLMKYLNGFGTPQKLKCGKSSLIKQSKTS